MSSQNWDRSRGRPDPYADWIDNYIITTGVDGPLKTGKAPRKRHTYVGRNGVKQSFWQLDIPAGKPIRDKSSINPYTMERTDNIIPNVYIADDTLGLRFYGRCDLLSSVFMTGQWAGHRIDIPAGGPEQDYKALDRLRSKIVGSTFDASVAIGTMHQNLELITDAAHRVAMALKSVRSARRDPRDLLDAWGHLVRGRPQSRRPPPSPALFDKSMTEKAVSNNWLALQYGWLPLLGDVKSAAEALASYMSEPLYRTYKANSNTLNRFSMSSPQAGCRFRQKSIERVQWGVKFKEGTSPPWTASWGLENPENLAWELLPWSFVVDWFMPIGDYLSARSVSSLAPGGTWYRSASHYWSIDGGSFDPTGMVNPVQLGTLGEYRIRRKFFSRALINPESVAPPRFKGVGEAMSWRRCANSLALLSGLRGNPVRNAPSVTSNRHVSTSTWEFASRRGLN